MYAFPPKETDIINEASEESEIGLENLKRIREDIDLESICCPSNRIASGAHCIIYRVENEDTVIRKSSGSPHNLYDSQDICKRYRLLVKNAPAIEQKLLESLDHPNIIKPIGICLYKDEYYQSLPYYTPISEWILNKTITKNHILKWTWQLFSVLNYLEENQIIHRDIRINNLLITEDEDIILIDFNCAVKVTNTNPRERLGGVEILFDYNNAYEWAPELRDVNLPLDFNADLYMAILSILLLLPNSILKLWNSSDNSTFIIDSFDSFTFGEETFGEAFPELYHLFVKGFHANPLERISSKQAFFEMNQIIANSNKKSAKK